MKLPIYDFIKNDIIPSEKLGNEDIRPGWTVKVHLKIKEGNKTRIQVFEGLVIKRSHGNEPGATLTVRKISNGVGVERVFPIYSPNIEKIEVTKKSKVRRAKLYYLRDKSAKEIRRKVKNIAAFSQVIPEEEPVTVAETESPEEPNK